MSTITKQWLQKAISQNESMRDEIPFGWDEDDINMLEALRIALASMEAKSRKLFTCSGCGAEGLDEPLESKCHCNEDGAHWVESVVYTAPPAPVSVPEHIRRNDADGWLMYKGRRVGGGCAEWYNRALDDCRAAMLQGADVSLTHEGKNHHEDKLGMVNHLGDVTEKVEPVTQIEPVADLYGLTSSTGGETSLTFDAVEARDFIDGGWSCQEYVELGRFQEAMLQNGNSPAQSDCCPEQNYIAPAQDGDYPVIPDGWVACSERMPEIGIKVLCFPVNDEPIHATYNGQVWLQDISWSTSDEPIDNVISCNVFHWMPLPNSPKE
ncbi:TPA: DUF551 domain-containing protein [Enterobacter roggenkampii]